MTKRGIIAGAVALMVLVSACAGTADSESTTTEAEPATTAAAPTTTAAAPTTTAPPATTTTQADDAGASITIANFNFSGATTVEAGTTVSATNQDDVSHTWTSDDDVWDSGNLRNGESFEFTFDEPGEYSYFCSIHPQMTGTITVEG